jgi:fructosamine-3-kinase
MLGDDWRARTEAALATCTDGARVRAVSPVGGGCISRTLRVTLTDGARVFVKVAEGHDPALLAAEARALGALRATATVRVPQVLAQGEGCLVLEWLEPGPDRESGWRDLGGQLAALHRHHGEWGGFSDNYIGTLPQQNTAAPNWAEFWALRRLQPQLRRAHSLLAASDRRALDELLRALPEVLEPAESEGPSLLHGDLWYGNVHMLAEGRAALVDPASSYGHREVDLAMADLFGGTPPAFHHGYGEAWPLAPGWEKRRPVYQLYYLLVHVNLFGPAYLPRTRAALRAAGF